jgi:hypothetical protein
MLHAARAQTRTACMVGRLVSSCAGILPLRLPWVRVEKQPHACAGSNINLPEQAARHGRVLTFSLV